MEPTEVRIPRTALHALAAAISVQTVASRTWSDGIDWFYPLGTWKEPHLKVALMPGGDEVWMRMSTDRASTVVWTIEQWLDFAGRLPGATPPSS
ncbi:hypothetical protein ACFW6N_21890 [Streptomyces cyaneofuscatus]|uniref:hypothetical protein n=1 Tax=Streptomyces cyaneofuscatus TaxID=66883 RepID=UPI00368FED16